ncbi:hypothetical protein VTK56DRAFT_10060 [Thermocarpiscus australiensis]
MSSSGSSDDGDMRPADSGALAPQTTMLGADSPEPTATTAGDSAAADPEPDVEPPSPPRKKPDVKICGVCGAQPGKYKCPRCSMPYCSVSCSKQHKENHPPDPPPIPNTPNHPTNTNDNPSSQDDPYRILLDHRSAFQRLFERYPSLPAELARIQQTTQPPPDNNPNPAPPKLPFAIPGLGTATNNNRRAVPWTKDVGLRKGAEALRRARTDPGETGDGVREFCDLVLFLLSKQAEAGKGWGGGGGRGGGGGDGAAMPPPAVARVREEVVAEETRVIARLLREEGG